MPAKARAGKSGLKHRVTLAIPVGC